MKALLIGLAIAGCADAQTGLQCLDYLGPRSSDGVHWDDYCDTEEHCDRCADAACGTRGVTNSRKRQDRMWDQISGGRVQRGETYIVHTFECAR